jgi:hypothetical protein
MTQRYTPDNCYEEDGSFASEDPEGEFIHYSDYEKLVTAIRRARARLSCFRGVMAAVILENALLDAGENPDE